MLILRFYRCDSLLYLLQVEYNKGMKYLAPLFLCFLCLLLFSCAMYEPVLNTGFVSSHLTKTLEFISVAIILLGLKKVHWRSVYNRLYYFYYSLAQLAHSLNGNEMKGTHGKIWKTSKDKPKTIFGKDFYTVREKSDYKFIENEGDFIKTTNEIILNEHKEIFQEQIDDIHRLFLRYRLDKEENMGKINIQINELIGNYNEFLNMLKSCQGVSQGHVRVSDMQIS